MIPDSSSMDRPVERPSASRRVWLAGALLAAALLAGWLLAPAVGRWLSAQVAVPRAQVRLGEVTRGDLVRDLSLQGRVVAAFHPTMSSPADGVARMAVRAGDEVSRGQVLARVESPELESRLAQETSTLASLAADLERQRILAEQTKLAQRQSVDLYAVRLEAAERAMERAERSRREGILNAVEYEEAEDALRVAGLELENARSMADFEADKLDFEVRDRESRLERQRLVVTDLERRVEELAVRSPVDGRVARLDVDDHDAVDRGQPLVGVVDLSAFEVEAMVPEAYADELVVGTPARVSHEGREWPALVENVAAEVEGSQVRTTLAFVEGSPEGLRQSQRLDVRLVLESRRDVLRAPRGPFVEAGGGREAYVVEDGVAVRRPIEVGAVSVSAVEIVAGLEEGERIVVSDTGRFAGAERVLLTD